jgi:hypothetical protein
MVEVLETFLQEVEVLVVLVAEVEALVVSEVEVLAVAVPVEAGKLYYLDFSIKI